MPSTFLISGKELELDHRPDLRRDERLNGVDVIDRYGLDGVRLAGGARDYRQSCSSPVRGGRP